MARRSVSLRLYIAGSSPHSLLALENLREFCERHLAGAHTLEVVDVLRHPARALDDHVLLTPTLVKLAPVPVRRVIGNLSDAAMLARSLDVRGL